MLVYPSPNCEHLDNVVCYKCYVEYILPGSLDVVLCNLLTYKLVLSYNDFL